MTDLLFEELNAGDCCRTYLVADAATREAAVIDPVLEHLDMYLAALERHGLQLRWVIDTHTHADHLTAAHLLAERTGALTAGAPAHRVRRPLKDGDALKVGGVTMQIWATPGHTADSLCLVLPDRVLTGDTLLIGLSGRTDLPTGDAEAEWRSLQRLLTLPDETLVFPAHDYTGRVSSTIGDERRKNPRLAKGHDGFIEEMSAPRASRPKRLAEALRFNAGVELESEEAGAG